MKRWLIVMLSVIILAGCKGTSKGIDGGLLLREKMTTGNGYRFRAVITADYGDRIYEFTMDCVSQSDGTVGFEVVAPETISGITGSISDNGGKLDFDGKILLFEPLTVGQLTPVIAPYLMVKAIQGGYIRYGNTGDDVCEYTIDDTFHSEAYQVILSVDKDLVPATCEIFWNNRRILSIQVENFVAL